MTNLPTDLDVARFFRSITEGRSVVLFLAKTTAQP